MAMAETTPSGTTTTEGASRTQRRPFMLMRARRLSAQSTPGQSGAAGGALAWLWPSDKPVYKRPGALIGAASVFAVIGWLVFAPKKAAPAAARPAAESK